MSTYQFYDPETDGVVYHVIPDHQPYTESISDIATETESTVSDMTILSEDLPEFFVEHHGRQQHASENAVRWFPADNTKRYILRHIVCKYLFGHNYVGPVKDMLWLDPVVGKHHHVLQIGTRDGTWTQEMATEFPHVQFRSVDIAPVMSHTPRPNIVFEVYDLTKGLLLEDGSQDIVFVNMGIELVKDYRALLREVNRVLRPGGLIHLHEFIPGVWDPRDQTKLARTTNPIACRLHDTIRGTVAQVGVDPDLCEKLPLWLAPGSDLWADSRARGFESIHTVTATCPFYPHDNYPCSEKLDPRLAPLIAHFFIACVRESFGVLRDAGLSVDEANSLIEGTIEEWKNPERCVLFKAYCIYGTKQE